MSHRPGVEAGLQFCPVWSSGFVRSDDALVVFAEMAAVFFVPDRLARLGRSLDLGSAGHIVGCDFIGIGRGIVVRCLGDILDFDRSKTGFGNPQRIGPVVIAAPPYGHVVLGAKLLQELFVQELVDHFLCGAALEVCRQKRCMIGSLRSRRQN